MNENEINAQDLLKEEDLLPKTEENQTFMEDFLNVVSEEPKTNSSIDLNEDEIEVHPENMIHENPKVETEFNNDLNNMKTQEDFDTIKQTEPLYEEGNPVTTLKQVSEPVLDQGLSSEPIEVGQISKEKVEIKVQKKNHWNFILTLFGIVAVFVLLLPLFIKWFGY